MWPVMMDDSAHQHTREGNSLKPTKLYSLKNGLWLLKYARRPTPKKMINKRAGVEMTAIDVKYISLYLSNSLYSPRHNVIKTYIYIPYTVKIKGNAKRVSVYLHGYRMF